MEYKIVESDSSNELSGLVNGLLAQGWELHGSLQATYKYLGDGYRDYFFAQALIKKTVDI